MGHQQQYANWFSKASPNASAGEDMEQELSLTAGGDARGAATLGESGQFLTRLTILLPCDPASTLLGVYSKELKMTST